jgi:hypothetical protein
VSSNGSLSYDVQQFGSSLCVWNGKENKSRSKEVAADFVIRISDGPEVVYDIARIPLCRAHSRNESFLKWLTRLTHAIALKTVTALRNYSLGEIRLTYRLVKREQGSAGLVGEPSGDRCQGCDAPGIKSPGETREIFAVTDRRERPFMRTFAVPGKRGVWGHAKTPRLVARARKAWYDLAEDEKALFNQTAAAKGLPGIYLFQNRYIKAVRRGERTEPLVYSTGLIR